MIDIFNIEENKITLNQLAYPLVLLSEKPGDGKTWNANEYLTSISPQGKKPLFLMFEDREKLVQNIKSLRIRSISDLEMVKSQLKNPKAKDVYSCIVFDTADKFDANEWIRLIKQAGANYLFPVAEHHDGFQMYKSELSEWNASVMGPKKDILGELDERIGK